MSFLLELCYQHRKVASFFRFSFIILAELFFWLTEFFVVLPCFDIWRPCAGGEEYGYEEGVEWRYGTRTGGHTEGEGHTPMVPHNTKRQEGVECVGSNIICPFQLPCDLQCRSAAASLCF